MKQTAAAIVLVAAQNAGRVGVSTAEVQGPTPRAIENSVQRLIRDNLLFKGKLGHRTVRYFAKREWADAYVAQRQVYVPAGAKRPTISRAQWAQDAPAIYPVDAEGKPLYKITTCPSPRQHPDKIRTGNYEPQ